MCAVEQPNPTGTSLSAESCCKDEISFYAVDNNYSPSVFQLNEPVAQVSQVFYIPATLGLQFISNKFSAYANVHPPGKFLTGDVSLPDICVFRI